MRRALLACLALAPLALFLVGAHALADHVGAKLGGSIAGLGRSLTVSERQEPPLVVLTPEASVELALREQPKPPKSQRMVHAPRKLPVPQKGVFVRAAMVLRLANAGMRPSGAFVPADGARPAGIALAGVSGLGIGLSDGDILTHAAGVPARSPAQVIGIVIGSRGARASQISGRFWRAGESYNLVVEQPYVKPRAENGS